MIWEDEAFATLRYSSDASSLKEASLSQEKVRALFRGQDILKTNPLSTRFTTVHRRDRYLADMASSSVPRTPYCDKYQ